MKVNIANIGVHVDIEDISMIDICNGKTTLVLKNGREVVLNSTNFINYSLEEASEAILNLWTADGVIKLN